MIDLKDVAVALAEPAKVLIEKVSAGIGILYEPTHIRKMALAQADAALIAELGRREISELQQRALYRLVKSEEQKQINMETVITKAIPLLESKSDVKLLKSDWLRNFFERCCGISDDDMQLLWANILSAEANIAGSFTKKTLSIVSELEKSDAVDFSNLCSFAWGDERSKFLVIPNLNHSILDIFNLDFARIKNLEALGLVSVEETGFYTDTDYSGPVVEQSYFGEKVRIVLSAEQSLLTGKVAFTKYGQQLSCIANANASSDIKLFVIDFWKNNGWSVQEI